MTLKTSEVLDLAADKIQQHGWTQFHGWAATPQWANAVDLGSSPGGELCLEGGIMAATGLRLGEEGVHADSVVHCPAYAAVLEYLEMPAHQRLFFWNDRPSRSAAEVIEVLRGAAAVERVREATLAYDTEDQPLPIEVAA